jgi:Eukaryotic aspartyl protease
VQLTSPIGLKKVGAQLIFGGYDTSRFASNGVSFSMADDVTRDLVVAVHSINYVGATQSSLLATPIHAFIDSTDPNLWLPKAACENFEKAFGLKLDNASGVYLINNSHHESLLSANAQVTFTLSDTIDGGETVSIVLPYAAFDLQAQYPLVSNISYYFPLKMAANDTQYTLGRTFLQEAYLTADYERNNFSVSQCTWVDGAVPNIVTIVPQNATIGGTAISSPTATSTSTATAAPKGIGAGEITGIIIPALVVIGFIAIGIWFFSRRSRIRKAKKLDADRHDLYIELPPDSQMSELHVEHRPLGSQELITPGVGNSHELSSVAGGETRGSDSNHQQLYEMRGSDAPIYEAPSEPVSRISTPLSQVGILPETIA